MPLPALQIHNIPNLRRLSDEIDIILGSGSPRRKDLLQQAGIPFRIVTVDVAEIVLDNEPSAEAAKRLASLKADAVAELSDNKDEKKPLLIIAADTIVWSEGACLGKPQDADEALRMLQSLRGRTHQVFTGVAMTLRHSQNPSVSISDVAVTKVTFKNVSDEELRRYIATGDPLDKAGAYGAQELGGFLVDHIDGELDTVIGFPLALVDELAGAILEEIKAG